MAVDVRLEPIAEARGGAIALRMTLWATFGVLFGLGPVIVNSIKSGMSSAGLDLTEVLGYGELFIVGAVIAGSAIGELIAAFVGRDFSSKPLSFKLIAILACFGTLLSLLANTAGYTVSGDPSTVRELSQWFFIATLVPSGAIIGMVATS
ncbi:hypothetical protein [Mycobacterium sp. ACS4331]|uniref:hypothetical protein n=1 Tax=Mycobacterium sp. ACS4331 TaxID=1834121 RepID=UPI0012FB795C|nr:hypothetical protein [Mycobacterium sp. ACS4331]